MANSGFAIRYSLFTPASARGFVPLWLLPIAAFAFPLVASRLLLQLVLPAVQDDGQAGLLEVIEVSKHRPPGRADAADHVLDARPSAKQLAQLLMAAAERFVA